MCTHESIPLDRGGGREHTTRHEPLALCGDLCDFQRMHHINVVHWVGYSTHMHASHTSINMFGTHACNGCLWTHSHSLGYGRQAYIYSWARVDIHHFDQRRERLPGWILLLWFVLPYSSRSIILGLIKFERMHATHHESSISVGILRFQSMVPHQICALRIQTPHTPLPYTWATCTEWVCLHTVLPRKVIGDKLAHFAGPCGRPSL